MSNDSNSKSIVLTDKVKLNARIKATVKSATKVQTDIHVCAVSALWHAEQHGDFGFLERLVYGLPAGQRVKTLQKWAKKYAPVNFSDKEKRCSKDKSNNAKPFDVVTAEADPYFNIVEVTEQKPLTMAAIIKYLEDKAKGKDTDTPEVKETRTYCGKVAQFAKGLAEVKEAEAAANDEAKPEVKEAA